jgi:hypothetical protein
MFSLGMGGNCVARVSIETLSSSAVDELFVRVGRIRGLFKPRFDPEREGIGEGRANC